MSRTEKLIPLSHRNPLPTWTVTFHKSNKVCLNIWYTRSNSVVGLLINHSSLRRNPVWHIKVCRPISQDGIQNRYLTPRGRGNMAAISQTTFSNAFSSIKIVVRLLKFQWNLLAIVKLTISHHCFRIWLGVGQATSRYLNQWWPSLLTHICVTRSRPHVSCSQHYYIPWSNRSCRWKNTRPRNVECVTTYSVLPMQMTQHINPFKTVSLFNKFKIAGGLRVKLIQHNAMSCNLLAELGAHAFLGIIIAVETHALFICLSLGIFHMDLSPCMHK